MVLGPDIRFRPFIPESGFRWIYRDSRGKWHPKGPPEDWPEDDYRSAAAFPYIHRPKPKLSGRFYIAASTYDCFAMSEFAPSISEPDLYLRFASHRPTPAIILEFANRYGLLSYQHSERRILRSAAPALVPIFDTRELPINAHDADALLLDTEEASDWLIAFKCARDRLAEWSKLRDQGDLQAMYAYLERNDDMSADMTYEIRLDNGQVRGDVIASSLADLLRIQWGISVSGNISHRPCAQCPSWFAVHAGFGRPEKQFCSNACRMRAYRDRNAARGKRTWVDKRSLKGRSD